MTDHTEKAIEAAVAVMLGRVNAPEQEIYRATRDAIAAYEAAMWREPVAWRYKSEAPGGHSEWSLTQSRKSRMDNARVILPREATEDMMLAGMASDDLMANATQGDAVLASYRAMRAASPNAGKVSEAELETMAVAYEACPSFEVTEGIRAALSAIGLEVE